MEELHLVPDLALILISAGITTLLFRRLKQPLVLGYIVAGFLISPHFGWLPSVIGGESVKEWSEIGIIFLLFALGLEFSFKKLMGVGNSAVITAITEVVTMFCVGFLVGHLLGWQTMESVFLGGMLSMSSTTIIIKAFGDLGLRKQKFTTVVFGTLVVEDIVAILLMVLLPTVAASREFSGAELLLSLLKLVFFLILCFLVGIYVLPSFFRQARRWINEETLLIIAIGLCFGLVTLATHIGFSAALGAFLMGSILAETIEGEHIEHLIGNIKDLFGAIFFVSVGMMVDPHVLIEYWLPILVLTLVTIFGKSFFSSMGVLLSGQSLKTSIQSGFSLAQIGEFAFIIAALGHSLGVMREFIYPVIVAISVITTFTTPYFIRLADPFYEWLTPRLSPKVKDFLENYSSGANDSLNYESDRRKLIKYYLTNFVIYGTMLVAVLLLFYHVVYPFTLKELAYLPAWLVHTINAALTITAMIPFLLGMMTNSRSKKEIINNLCSSGSRFSRHLVIVVRIFRIAAASLFVMAALFINFRNVSWAVSVIIAAGIITAVFYARRKLRAHWIIEDRFRSNLRQKEEYRRKQQPIRSSIDSKLSNRDIHFADVVVSADSPFVGKMIKELDVRNQYGVNIVKITRGSKEIYFPEGHERVYPSDQLMAIGTDEQIASFTGIMEVQAQQEALEEKPEINLLSMVVEYGSDLYHKTVAESGFRELGSLIVSVDRGKQSFINPDRSFRFEVGDLVWIVGEKEKVLNSTIAPTTEKNNGR